MFKKGSGATAVGFAAIVVAFAMLLAWQGTWDPPAAVGRSANSNSFESSARRVGDSVKLAAENARYLIKPDEPGNGLRADNEANHLSVKFDGADTLIDGGVGAPTKLCLTGYGWGNEALRSAGAVVKIESTGQRLDRSYSSGLGEWFLNTSQGLKQGFVFTKRDTATNASLRIQLSTSAGWRTIAAGDAILLTNGAFTLRYGGSNALDAKGVVLTSRMRVVNSTLEIEVDDAHAVFPLTLVRTITRLGEKRASGEENGNYFGLEIAAAGDRRATGL